MPCFYFAVLRVLLSAYGFRLLAVFRLQLMAYSLYSLRFRKPGVIDKSRVGKRFQKFNEVKFFCIGKRDLVLQQRIERGAVLHPAAIMIKHTGDGRKTAIVPIGKSNPYISQT